MKTTDLISLSTRMFTTRPLRTFLTILGVGIGIGAVLFLVSLGYGLQNVILNQITTADALLSLDVTPAGSGLLELSPSRIERIAQFEHVAEISRIKNISAQFTLGELTGSGIVNAIDPQFFKHNGIKADHGRVFDGSESNVAVVSSAVAQLFNLDSDGILDKQLAITLLIPRSNADGSEDVEISVQPQPFTVVGVVEDESNSFLYLPLQGISTSGITQYDSLKVKVDSQANLENVREAVIQEGFIVSSLTDVIDQAVKIFRIVQFVLGLFGLIALIVSAIGMFNTMTIALLERINEIGIMRSIGITRRDIKKMFLVESMLMGFLGGLFGITLGYLAGELVNWGVNMLAKNLGGQSFDLFYQPAWFVLFIMIFSTIIGLLTGIFPSQRAAKMDPLEALRYK